MNISNSTFLKYTINTTPENMQNINVVSKTNVQYSEATTCNNNINIAVKEGEICVENIGSTISDEAWEGIIAANNPSAPTTQIKLSTTYKDFSPIEISKIKQLIYDLHNSPDIEEGEGGDNGEIGDGGEIEEGGDGSEPSVKQSFIKDFADTETMFEYMHTKNSEITKETGITRAQLIEFTQNDEWEDNNYDFFGSLNRIFSQLDKDGDDILSYDEIKTFITNELGSDFATYQNKVNIYSDLIQAEYATKTDQEKLEFAIEKTREYLTASNMTPELQALERLLEKDDLFNSIKVGQIAIADLQSGTLGSYRYSGWVVDDYNNDSDSYDFAIFSNDDDNKEEGNDFGITLDVSLLEANWYVLVNTLVHELTHATAYRYYTSDNNGDITIDILKKLSEIGALTADEEKWYTDNWLRVICASEGSEYEDKLYRLYYLASCTWGEYSAYQNDADYNDSIGQDVYHSTYDNTTTAVDGPNERDTILTHVDSYYNDDENTEAIPDYKWWSYA